MRIFIPVLDFSRSGGARVLAKLASAWVAAGQRPIFLASQWSEPPYFPTTAEIYWLDDEGRRVETDVPKNALRTGPTSVVRHLGSLRRALRRYARPGDVVLANHSLTAWPAWLSRCGAKLFYYVQAYEPEYYEVKPGVRAKFLRLMAWASYRLPLTRIVNGEIYVSFKGLRARHVVPPGIDYALFRPDPARPPDADLKNRPVVVGCVGRTEPDKGTIYSVAAFEELVRRGRDVEFRVAYGNIPPAIAAHPRCRVVVPRDDAELAEFYRSLDVVLAPGLGQHGAPHYPVMEGMACGVPVVTTGYLPSAEDNCWLVPERDGAAVADAVDAIVADPRERRRRVENALAAIRPFEWSEVARKMLRLLEA